MKKLLALALLVLTLGSFVYLVVFRENATDRRVQREIEERRRVIGPADTSP